MFCVVGSGLAQKRQHDTAIRHTGVNCIYVQSAQVKKLNETVGSLGQGGSGNTSRVSKMVQKIETGTRTPSVKRRKSVRKV